MYNWGQVSINEEIVLQRHLTTERRLVRKQLQTDAPMSLAFTALPYEPNIVPKLPRHFPTQFVRIYTDYIRRTNQIKPENPAIYGLLPCAFSARRRGPSCKINTVAWHCNGSCPAIWNIRYISCQLSLATVD